MFGLLYNLAKFYRKNIVIIFRGKNDYDNGNDNELFIQTKSNEKHQRGYEYQ